MVFPSTLRCVWGIIMQENDWLGRVEKCPIEWPWGASFWAFSKNLEDVEKRRNRTLSILERFITWFRRFSQDLISRQAVFDWNLNLKYKLHFRYLRIVIKKDFLIEISCSIAKNRVKAQKTAWLFAKEHRGANTLIFTRLIKSGLTSQEPLVGYGRKIQKLVPGGPLQPLKDIQ